MPYREESHSPPRRTLERSPSPEHDRNGSAGPSKKPRPGAMDNQRRQLEKLLRNPEKEVQMPTGPKEKTLRPPPEMVKNVQGSASAAGSGEFHVYKHSRRREYERLKMMETKDKALAEQREFMERQAARDAVTDAKTAKNRAKRQRRKNGRKGGAGDEDGGAGGAVAAGDPKRKLAGGGGLLATGAAGGVQDGDEESGDEGDVGPALPVAATPAAAPVAAEQREIIIHDDD